MLVKRRFRPIFLLFLLLVASLLIPSVLATSTATYYAEEAYAWLEIGSGSANGDGIGGDLSYLPSLAISPDGNPIIAWQELIGVKYAVYVRRWDGSAWVEMGSGSASGSGISNGSIGAEHPSLAVGPDGMPMIAWHAWPGGDTEIYVRRWDGNSWVEVGSGSASGGGISNTSGNSYVPSLAIGPDGKPIVVWFEPFKIYVRQWDGSAWVEMGSGSASGGGISDSGDSDSPSLSISPDGTPIVAWTDGMNLGGKGEIYARFWDGTSWVEMGSGASSGGGISDNVGDSMMPSLAISPEGTPIVAWTDNSSGDWEIYVRQWDGSAWVEMGSGSASGGGISDSGVSYSPSLAISPEGTPIVAWTDNSSGDSQIYVKRWDGNSWVEMGNSSATAGGISDNNGSSRDVSLAVDQDGTPITAWNDNSGSGEAIYVRQWQPFVSPVAEFQGTPTEGVFPLVVQFTNLSTGDFERCLWCFGDGEENYDCSDVLHVYKDVGSYPVSLSASVPGTEDMIIKTDYITVNDYYRIFLPGVLRWK